MRWALAKVALAVTSMVAVAFLVPLGFAVDRIAAQRAYTDAQAKATAIEQLLVVTTNQTPLRNALATGGLTDIGLELPDGTQIGSGHASPQQLAAARSSQTAALITVPGGLDLIQPVVLSGNRLAVIQVFIDSGQERAGVIRVWLILGAVAAALVLGSTLVADRLATRVVGAARHLAAASRRLGDGDTSVRVVASGPVELREAGVAFNAMADRVVHLLAAEREMVADLSHRLRTPLTALRLNANSLGDAPAAASTREAVAKLEQEVDTIIRAARAGSAGISLAMAAANSATDSASALTVAPGCDAAEVISERMVFWSALAEDQRRAWELIAPPACGPAASPGPGAASARTRAPVQVPVPGPELAAALDALLGNVFRHTPEGTAFQVTVDRVADTVCILVDDAGPGLAEPERALRRGEGTGGPGSTGLGLDIVRRLAERTGGSLGVEASPLGGTRIRMNILTAPTQPAEQPRRRARRAPG